MPVQENQTIGEVISGMMSEARRLGFAESYIWDRLQKATCQIRKYYRDNSIRFYSSEVTKQFLEKHVQRFEKGEIRKSYIAKIETAIRCIEEYYLTGTLSIYSNRVRSPIILPPYYEHLLDEFLTEHNYGAKACHDASFRWISDIIFCRFTQDRKVASAILRL